MKYSPLGACFTLLPHSFRPIGTSLVMDNPSLLRNNFVFKSVFSKCLLAALLRLSSVRLDRLFSFQPTGRATVHVTVPVLNGFFFHVVSL